jgi:predicted transcriptional regulator
MCHAKLELWKTRYQTQYLVCFDFDKVLWRDMRDAYQWGAALSSDYDHDVDHLKLGYTALAKKLQKRIGNKGYVFNSAKSGRPKIILAVEYEDPVKAPHVPDLIALAQHLFPEYTEENCIDLKRSAFSSSFIPWDKRIELRDMLPRLTPIKITKSAENITFKTEQERVVIASTFTYLCAHKLPKELYRRGDSYGYRKFLRVLCTMSAMAKKGFGISQKIMARTLRVSQQTVSRYVRRAKAQKILSVSNDRYQVSKRAKTYKARGALRKFIKNKIKSVLTTKLPTRIRKGCWHSTMIYYAIIRFRTNPEGFLKWIKGVKGVEENDRKEQAIGIYKWLIGIRKKLGRRT